MPELDPVTMATQSFSGGMPRLLFTFFRVTGYRMLRLCRMAPGFWLRAAGNGAFLFGCGGRGRHGLAFEDLDGLVHYRGHLFEVGDEGEELLIGPGVGGEVEAVGGDGGGG